MTGSAAVCCPSWDRVQSKPGNFIRKDQLRTIKIGHRRLVTRTAGPSVWRLYGVEAVDTQLTSSSLTNCHSSSPARRKAEWPMLTMSCSVSIAWETRLPLTKVPL